MRGIQQYIDLHLHLDGAITPEIARKLAAQEGVRLPEEDDQLRKMLTVPPECESLNEFLQCFALPCSLMQTPRGVREAVRLVADNVMSQGVIYAEIRFAPQLLTGRGMSQEEAVLAAVGGLKETKLKANLILCFMRGSGNDTENEETLRLAKKHLVRDGGVTAVDLAGAEALYPTAKYRELFADVKREGIPFTIHAGEADGAESVRLAAEYGAKRIGHGVRCTEDPEVVRMIRDQGITLELCPTSNRMTRAVKDMADYPFMDLLKAGIRVTVNTDDMGVEGIDLAHEYRWLEKRFGLTAEQEKTVLGNAADAAFTTEEVKAGLRRQLGL